MMTADQWDQTIDVIRARDQANRHQGERLYVNLHIGEQRVLADVLQRPLHIYRGCFVVEDMDCVTTWYIPVERVTAVTTTIVKAPKP